MLKIRNQIKKIPSLVLLAVITFVMSGFFGVISPHYAHASGTIYNIADFRQYPDGVISATNGNGINDPATFTDLSGDGLPTPEVHNKAFQGDAAAYAVAVIQGYAAGYNVAAIPTRGDGRLTALFGGQAGVAGDTDNRWGLEWFDFAVDVGGYRVQVQPNWTQLKVERTRFGSVESTMQVITLSHPLVPNVDRVSFDLHSGTWRVFVNGIQVSADLVDTTYTNFTDVVMGALSPSGHTFPRWAWWAYTSGEDINIDPNPSYVPNNGDANNDGIQDNLQPNVTSFTSTVTNQPVGLQLSQGCNFVSSNAVAQSSNGAADGTYTYPQGMVNFTGNCGINGFTSTVTLYFYGVTNNNYTLRKYNPNTKTYAAVPDTTLTNTTIGGQNVLKATYQVTDGSAQDADGQTNGIIVDPVGLALSTTTPVSAPDTGIGKHSDSMDILSIGLGLGLVTLAGYQLKRRSILFK